MFDDVLDVIDTAFAADTYKDISRPIVRTADLLKNSGAGQIARGYGPISWGIRGADYLFNDLVIVDLPPGIAEQLRAEAAQARAGAFTGDVIQAADGDQAGAGGAANDGGAQPPAGDRVVTGVFDP